MTGSGSDWVSDQALELALGSAQVSELELGSESELVLVSASPSPKVNLNKFVILTMKLERAFELNVSLTAHRLSFEQFEETCDFFFNLLSFG